MEDALLNPFVMVGVLVLLIGALLLARHFRKGAAIRESGHVDGLDELLRKGDYVSAAMLCQRKGDFEQAIEYFLRAQQPLRAAQVAARTNNARRAAELFEQGGAPDRAAELYVEAGMHEKARELRNVKGAAKPDQRADVFSAIPGAGVVEGEASDPLAEFREAASRTGDDVQGRAALQELGAKTAEQLLRSGEIRKAAEVYREAGLVDEAVHLYVNVLGTPGEAAPLMAERGNHARAAELYEMAGKLERAAAIWVDIARSSSQPEIYIERIERLSEDVAARFLEETVVQQPLSAATVELHYRLAALSEKRGDQPRALTIFQQIAERVGDYKDVGNRLRTLKSAGSDGPPPPRPAASPSDRVQVVAAPDGRGPSLRPSGGYSRMSPEDEPCPPSEPLPAFAAGTARVPGVQPPPPPDTAPAVPSGVVHPDLSPDQLSAIARQAALAVIEQTSRTGVFGAGRGPQPASSSRRGANRPAGPIIVVGLESQQLPNDMLADDAARAARQGPAISALRGYIADRPCDLQNIEVYYRLGLAHLAAGQWEEALESFEAVEDASPGYRDADKRAEQLRGWKKAVGARGSILASGAMRQGSAESRYKILGELGRGGMAVVYRANDEVLGREVALKFLAEELTSQKEMRDMFQREARSVAQLNHPNIITVYDYGVLDGRAFICMEYVEGFSVDQLIDQRGKLTIIEALRMTSQVLEALDYAHQRNVIHRDIKPSNMMLGKTGLVKLMDFGLAKSIAASAKASIIAGTPAYMPPEQFVGGDVDHRADIFAVGCSLYEMLTGQLPFPGADRSQPAPELRSHDPALPEALERILARALQLDVGGRYGSAEAFRADIRRILEAVDRYTSSKSSPPGPSQVSASGSSAPREQGTVRLRQP